MVDMNNETGRGKAGDMAVAINWGVDFLGVLILQALLFWGLLGPLIFGNCQVASKQSATFKMLWPYQGRTSGFYIGV